MTPIIISPLYPKTPFWYNSPLNEVTVQRLLIRSLQIFQIFGNDTKKSKSRTALFWAIVQLVVVIPYRRFRTTYRFHLRGSRVKIARVKGLRLD